MPENHKSLLLSFIFFLKRETVGLAGSLAQSSDPAGHKKGRSPLNEQSKMHAKRPRYCSSELKFT
jgi:hypothetical protein